MYNSIECIAGVLGHLRSLISVFIQGQQVRHLKHFQYLEWPDVGSVPDEQSLISFVEVVRDQIPPRGEPIVVHCRSVDCHSWYTNTDGCLVVHYY